MAYYRVFLLFLTFIFYSMTVSADSDHPDKSLIWSGYAKIEDVYNVRGGIKQGSVLNGVGAIKSTLNTEAAQLWSGGQFTLGILGIVSTHNQSFYTGAIQTVSNLSAQSLLRLSDFAYEQTVTETTKIRLGVMDINNYFNVTEAASGLLNSAFGVCPILSANMPVATYPYSGYGAIIDVTTNPLEMQLGIFQGNPQHLHTVFYNGYTLIGEIVGHLDPNQKSGSDIILKGGAWHYAQSNPTIGHNTDGLYVIAERIWKNTENQQRGVFLQLGSAPKKTNTVPYYFGGGFNTTALFPERASDVLSLGFTQVRVRGASAETIFEITYAIQLANKFSLIPDLQYVLNPAGIYRNAIVGMLRLSFTP